MEILFLYPGFIVQINWDSVGKSWTWYLAYDRQSVNGVNINTSLLITPWIYKEMILTKTDVIYGDLERIKRQSTSKIK